MRTESRVLVADARNSPADFCREILGTVAVENVGKKLPGYSFGRLARHLWPQKTPASIEFYTQAPERTARHIAADKSDPASELLVKVLDSDQGWRALQWIMRDSKQPWWRELQKHKRMGAAADTAGQQIEMEV